MRPNFKYAVIHRYCTKYTVKALCEILQVSRSGYYKYVKHLNRTAKDFELAEKIRTKQESCKKTYGYRRMKLWLDSEGITKNPKTILRIMHKYDLLSEIRRRKRWRKMGEDKHRYDNWLNREFNAEHCPMSHCQLSAFFSLKLFCSYALFTRLFMKCILMQLSCTGSNANLLLTFFTFLTLYKIYDIL